MDSKVVLAVEDELLVREYLADVLQDAGFEVLTAGNADEAITILEYRRDICLIVTDIDMPGSMDGARLAVMVRDRWPPIHIVVTTGKQRPPSLPSNSHFIPKPYTTNDMVGIVASLC